MRAGVTIALVAALALLPVCSSPAETLWASGVVVGVANPQSLLATTTTDPVVRPLGTQPHAHTNTRHQDAPVSSSLGGAPTTALSPVGSTAPESAAFEHSEYFLRKEAAYQRYVARAEAAGRTPLGKRVWKGMFDERFESMFPSVNGNSLAAMGPHDVYALFERRTGRLLRFGETGRGYLTRLREWQAYFLEEYGMPVTARRVASVEGKAAARHLETRMIRRYERAYGSLPPYQKTYH